MAHGWYKQPMKRRRRDLIQRVIQRVDIYQAFQMCFPNERNPLKMHFMFVTAPPFLVQCAD